MPFQFIKYPEFGMFRFTENDCQIAIGALFLKTTFFWVVLLERLRP
jgi:hypothetical protein